MPNTGTKLFIGIKEIYYGDPLTADLASGSDVKTLLSSFTKVLNSHDGTWGYTQDDPSTTEYVNELTGKTYYRDKTSAGAHNITFTLGAYDYADKAALQGGAVVPATGTAAGWKDNGALTNVNKAIIALTKTDKYIVFSNASIVAKVDTQEKNLGLGITATAQENETTGVAPEYWFDKTE